MIVIWHGNNTVEVWTIGHSIWVRLEEHFLIRLENREGPGWLQENICIDWCEQMSGHQTYRTMVTPCRGGGGICFCLNIHGDIEYKLTTF